jgi:transcriptional regulator with XRE-family HTH domain
MAVNTFWGRVKPLVKAHQFTQKQFADYLGVPIRTLEGWIHYSRIPDTRVIYDIAAALGVTIDYLMTGKDRNIAEKRRQELTARIAAARIAELTAEIQRKVKLLRPLQGYEAPQDQPLPQEMD